MSTQMKSMRVNTNEEEVDDDDVVDVVSIVKERKCKRKCLIISSCGIILTLVLIITIILSLRSFYPKHNETKTTKEEAVDLLNNLENVDGNFTDYHLNTFNEAFNTFDHNNDGFLNETEFSEYVAIQVSDKGTYTVIDADNDTILSYREVVGYLTEMIKTEYLYNTYFKQHIIPIVENYYNYNYSNSDPLFIEYAANLMYFNSFDVDSNGYIRYNEYLLIVSQFEFNFADGNLDGILSKDEFFNVLYGNDIHSFKGVVKRVFDDEFEDKFIESMNNITLTLEQVKQVQINFCPTKSVADVQRRRLWTFGMSCGYLPNGEFICICAYVDADGNPVMYVC